MLEERLYYHDLCYIEQGIHYLNHFSLSIFAGEVLQVVCIHEHEKEQLIPLLHGDLPPDAGTVFSSGKPISPSQLTKTCYVIRETSDLVEELTAGENIFVLRPHKISKIILNSRAIHTHTQSLFDSFGLNIPADAPVSRLTALQKYLVSLVKAYTSNAKVIFVDTASKHFPENAQLSLRELYQRFTDKGIALVFFSTHPSDHAFTSDRVALYDHGRILRTYPGYAFSTAEFRKFLAPGTPLPAPSKKTQFQQEQLLSVSLPWGDLQVSGGEILGLYDPTGEGYDALFSALTDRRAGKQARPVVCGEPLSVRDIPQAFRHGIIFLNHIDIQKNIVCNLTVMDNLYLSSYQRLTTAGIFRRNLFQHSAQKYTEQFDLPAEALTGRISPADYHLNLRVYLERIALSRPKLVICRDIYEKSAEHCRQVLDNFIAQLSQDGAAVILSAPTGSTLYKLCNRIIDTRCQNTTEE